MNNCLSFIPHPIIFMQLPEIAVCTPLWKNGKQNTWLCHQDPVLVPKVPHDVPNRRLPPIKATSVRDDSLGAQTSVLGCREELSLCRFAIICHSAESPIIISHALSSILSQTLLIRESATNKLVIHKPFWHNRNWDFGSAGSGK
jgi:hypothetical protein